MKAETTMGGAPHISKAEVQPAYWSGVFAMMLCVFVLIASEFMPPELCTVSSKR